MAELPQDIVQAVAIGNLKSIAEQPAMLSNLAYSNSVANTNLSHQNAVANQQALNELGVTILSKAVNAVANIGPMEARSASYVLTGNELASNAVAMNAVKPKPAKAE